MAGEQEQHPNAGEERSGIDEQETTPAEERGERLDTGKTIARGGKQAGPVPGAEPRPDADRRQ
jgi:hypothetical protein